METILLKRCSKCGLEKDADTFETNSKTCPDCRREARRKYEEEHPEVKERKAEKQRERRNDPVFREKENQRLREYRKVDPSYKEKKKALKKTPKHRERASARARERLLDPEYNEKVNSQRRERAKDPERKNKRAQQRKTGRKKASSTALVYQTKKRESDPTFKILMSLRNRLGAAMKAKGIRKTLTTLELTGSMLDGLKAHLESKWKEGMTWDNYGKDGWHIDHVKPCALFDLSDPEQQKECFNYKNLQPLWWWENFEKSKQYEEIVSVQNPINVSKNGSKAHFAK